MLQFPRHVRVYMINAARCLIKCFMAETTQQMNTGHDVNNGKVGTIIAFIDSDSLYDSVIVCRIIIKNSASAGFNNNKWSPPLMNPLKLSRFRSKDLSLRPSA